MSLIKDDTTKWKNRKIQLLLARKDKIFHKK
jgi:hypothetical protein